jgi:hypothetical protein
MSQESSLNQVVNTPEKAKQFMQQLAFASKEAYVLSYDFDATTFSRPQPFAVTFDKALAEEWKKNLVGRNSGYTYRVSVDKLPVVSTMEEIQKAF